MHKSIAFIAACFLLALSIPAEMFAATQGKAGTTSVATAVITMIIPAQYKISNVNDFSLGEYSGSGRIREDQDLCVYSNGDGNYNVLATDDSTASPTDFSIQNAAGTASIPYRVFWNDTTGTTGNQRLSYNEAEPATSANTTSTDCSVGGNSANIQIRITNNSLNSAVGDAYSATLILTIQP